MLYFLKSNFKLGWIEEPLSMLNFEYDTQSMSIIQLKSWLFAKKQPHKELHGRDDYFLSELWELFFWDATTFEP